MPDDRRRRILAAAGALCAGGASVVRAEEAWPIIPALSALLDKRELKAGRVHLDIPKLADNGNSVPLVVTALQQARSAGGLSIAG